MATAWTLYNKAKKNIGNGVISLGVSAFRMKLCTSSSNAATATLSTFQSANSEVSGGGYTANGKAIGTPQWTTGTNATQYKFTGNAVVFTANGSNLVNVKFAVIGTSANGKLLCYSCLSASQFNVVTSNTLTITPDANGIFTLT
jgi:hypothetical protein